MRTIPTSTMVDSNNNPVAAGDVVALTRPGQEMIRARVKSVHLVVPHSLSSAHAEALFVLPDGSVDHAPSAQLSLVSSVSDRAGAMGVKTPPMPSRSIRSGNPWAKVPGIDIPLFAIAG